MPVGGGETAVFIDWVGPGGGVDQVGGELARLGAGEVQCLVELAEAVDV